MSVADFCFCAVVSEKALQAILDGHAQGIYRDNHPWIIAAERFHEAREKDRLVPIVFATGESLELSHWSIVESIDVQEFHAGAFESRCTFDVLTPVNPIWTSLDSLSLSPSVEQLRREDAESIHIHRQPLDATSIRPYAICETPAFIVSNASD